MNSEEKEEHEDDCEEIEETEGGIVAKDQIPQREEEGHTTAEGEAQDQRRNAVVNVDENPGRGGQNEQVRIRFLDIASIPCLFSNVHLLHL